MAPWRTDIRPGRQPDNCTGPVVRAGQSPGNQAVAQCVDLHYGQPDCHRAQRLQKISRDGRSCWQPNQNRTESPVFRNRESARRAAIPRPAGSTPPEYRSLIVGFVAKAAGPRTRRPPTSTRLAASVRCAGKLKQFNACSVAETCAARQIKIRYRNITADSPNSKQVLGESR